jgi:hypothetical protein
LVGDEVLPASTGGGGGLRGGAGQDLADRGLPACLGDSEAATDGGAEKFIGVGWALMTDDVLGELLQLEEGKGKVRDHPAGEERRVEGELTVEGHRRPEMRRGAAAVQPLAWMRGRGEREGAHGVL